MVFVGQLFEQSIDGVNIRVQVLFFSSLSPGCCSSIYLSVSLMICNVIGSFFLLATLRPFLSKGTN